MNNMSIDMKNINMSIDMKKYENWYEKVKCLNECSKIFLNMLIFKQL